MKTILLSAFALLSLTAVQAQERQVLTEQPATNGQDDQKDDPPFRAVEQPPQPGFNILEYLNKNLQYPAEAKEKEVEGRVMVSFVVNKDGSISNIEIVRGKELGHGLPEEATRLVKNMPKWKPGKQNGQQVRVYYTMPITFKLN